jgi:hypothetical protein
MPRPGARSVRRKRSHEGGEKYSPTAHFFSETLQSEETRRPLMTDVRQAPTALMALPMSTREWRVSHPTRVGDAMPSLVGFVRDIGGVFETTTIGRPLFRAYFASLDEAVASFDR